MLLVGSCYMKMRYTYINKHLLFPAYFPYFILIPFSTLNSFYTLCSQEAAGFIVRCKQIFD